MTAHRVLGVDTHVHLGSFESPRAVVAASLAAGVRVVVSTERASEYRELAVLLPLSASLQLGLGLHPMHAADVAVETELAIFRDQFASARWISEIGLDGFFAANGGPSIPQQRHVFDSILALGVGDRILSVHSREAEDLTFELVSSARPGAAIFHWYDGSVAQATAIAAAGYYFSVNSFMVASAAHRDLLRWLPIDRILTETDGPTTVMPDGRGCVPQDVLEIAAILAGIRGDDVAALSAQVVANTERLEASV